MVVVKNYNPFKIERMFFRKEKNKIERMSVDISYLLGKVDVITQTLADIQVAQSKKHCNFYDGSPEPLLKHILGHIKAIEDYIGVEIEIRSEPDKYEVPKPPRMVDVYRAVKKINTPTL